MDDFFKLKQNSVSRSSREKERYEKQFSLSFGQQSLFGLTLN